MKLYMTFFGNSEAYLSKQDHKMIGDGNFINICNYVWYGVIQNIHFDMYAYQAKI